MEKTPWGSSIVCKGPVECSYNSCLEQCNYEKFDTIGICSYSNLTEKNDYKSPILLLMPKFASFTHTFGAKKMFHQNWS